MAYNSLKLSAMTAIHKTSILFDDSSMMTTLVDKKAFNLSSPAIDCDCTSHNSTADNQDVDTDQVAPSAYQAH